MDAPKRINVKKLIEDLDREALDLNMQAISEIRDASILQGQVQQLLALLRVCQSSESFRAIQAQIAALQTKINELK